MKFTENASWIPGDKTILWWMVDDHCYTFLAYKLIYIEWCKKIHGIGNKLLTYDKHGVIDLKKIENFPDYNIKSVGNFRIQYS